MPPPGHLRTRCPLNGVRVGIILTDAHRRYGARMERRSQFLGVVLPMKETHVQVHTHTSLRNSGLSRVEAPLK